MESHSCKHMRALKWWLNVAAVSLRMYVACLNVAVTTGDVRTNNAFQLCIFFGWTSRLVCIHAHTLVSYCLFQLSFLPQQSHTNSSHQTSPPLATSCCISLPSHPRCNHNKLIPSGCNYTATHTPTRNYAHYHGNNLLIMETWHTQRHTGSVTGHMQCVCMYICAYGHYQQHRWWLLCLLWW